MVKSKSKKSQKLLKRAKPARLLVAVIVAAMVGGTGLYLFSTNQTPQTQAAFPVHSCPNYDSGLSWDYHSHVTVWKNDMADDGLSPTTHRECVMHIQETLNYIYFARKPEYKLHPKEKQLAVDGNWGPATVRRLKQFAGRWEENPYPDWNPIFPRNYNGEWVDFYTWAAMVYACYDPPLVYC